MAALAIGTIIGFGACFALEHMSLCHNKRFLRVHNGGIKKTEVDWG